MTKFIILKAISRIYDDESIKKGITIFENNSFQIINFIAEDDFKCKLQLFIRKYFITQTLVFILKNFLLNRCNKI